jgi:hypothetical protein
MLWKFKVETLFKAKELRGLINGEEVKPYWLHVPGLLAYEKKER